MPRATAIALALSAIAFFARPTDARARAPVPASASPQARPATPAPTADPAKRVHRGIVTCDGAPFYSWPDRSSEPSGTAYPPARSGDSIDVIGDATLAASGITLYETTIDVFAPFGSGRHYYISARCINAG